MILNDKKNGSWDEIGFLLPEAKTKKTFKILKPGQPREQGVDNKRQTAMFVINCSDIIQNKCDRRKNPQ